MNLAGMRILVTRPQSQAGEFMDCLRQAGAHPIAFPVIQIQPVEDGNPLDAALRSLGDYNWVIFTSANGVQMVWQRLAELGLPGIPPSVRTAAIGPKTAAALQERQVQVNYIPSEYIAEAILPGLGDLQGKRVLLLRADLARPDLARLIEQAGAVADEIAAYRTTPAQPDSQALQALRQGVDIVTFTSSSTVRNFVELAGAAGLDVQHLPGKPLFACIGPITAATAAEFGLPVDIVATEYTTDGLLAALQEYNK
jgi:uroporphyrinogen-III synthase